MFELNPMAFLMERAGGAASTGRARFSTRSQKIEERAPIFIGCRKMWPRAEKFIAACDLKAGLRSCSPV